MKKLKNWKLDSGLILVYEDKDIMVADKPPGLLTIGTAKEKTKTAHFILSEYLHRGRGKGKIFVVHRLDRETSGLLVFARNEKSKEILQKDWESAEKIYLACVSPPPKETEGIIESNLSENASSLLVYSDDRPGSGKHSVTEYRTVKTSRSGNALLEILLHTGRKHQIRVHMADRGHPVIGDGKYGSKKEKGRLCLHAASLAFRHPVTGKTLQFHTEIPFFFTRMFGDAADWNLKWLRRESGSGQ